MLSGSVEDIRGYIWENGLQTKFTASNMKNQKGGSTYKGQVEQIARRAVGLLDESMHHSKSNGKLFSFKSRKMRLVCGRGTNYDTS